MKTKSHRKNASCDIKDIENVLYDLDAKQKIANKSFKTISENVPNKKSSRSKYEEE